MGDCLCLFPRTGEMGNTATCLIDFSFYLFDFLLLFFSIYFFNFLFQIFNVIFFFIHHFFFLTSSSQCFFAQSFLRIPFCNRILVTVSLHMPVCHNCHAHLVRLLRAEDVLFAWNTFYTSPCLKCLDQSSCGFRVKIYTKVFWQEPKCSQPSDFGVEPGQIGKEPGSF